MSIQNNEGIMSQSWERFFRIPTVHWTQLAPSNQAHGLVCSNKTGVSQLYAWEIPTGTFVQLTDLSNGVNVGILSPEGDYVYYLEDQMGNEIGHIVRVPFDSGPSQDITPEFPPYPVFGLAISRAGNILGMISANAEGFQLFLLQIQTDGTLGSPQLLYKSSAILIQPCFSYDGEVMIIATNIHTGTQELSLLAFDTTTGAMIEELWDKPSGGFTGGMFEPVAGSTQFVTVSSLTGKNRPLLWNPCTNERRDLMIDRLDCEISICDWSSDGERLLLCQFDSAVQRFFLYSVRDGTLTTLQHPGGTYWHTYFGPNDEIWSQWTNITNPLQLVSLTSELAPLTRLILSSPEISSDHHCRSVNFLSSDGQSIQGWLETPATQGPFPTIILLHGGPFSVATEAFSPENQSWLHQGFALLRINYRGSTTFGRDFQMQILGDVGHWEVEDIVSARSWLIEQKIARFNQIFLMGWSYGGYLTLQTVGKYPGLWASGIAGAAITDWTIQYEDSSETFKRYMAALFGNIPTHIPDQYHHSSPITHLSNVTTPLLIIQGLHDSRCPPRQIQRYYEEAQKLGKSIEVYWYNAGHKSLSIDEQIAHHAYMQTFLQHILHHQNSDAFLDPDGIARDKTE